LRAIARPVNTPAQNRTSERSFMSVLPSRDERLAYPGRAEGHW
jgi:hypothetical protein